MGLESLRSRLQVQWTAQQRSSIFSACVASLTESKYSKLSASTLVNALGGQTDDDPLLKSWSERFDRYVEEKCARAGSEVRARQSDIKRAVPGLYHELSKRVHGNDTTDIVTITIGPGHFAAADGEALVLMLDFFRDECEARGLVYQKELVELSKSD